MTSIQENSVGSNLQTTSSSSTSKKDKLNSIVTQFFDLLCKPYSVRQILIYLFQIELNIANKVRRSGKNNIEEIEQLWLESLSRKEMFTSLVSSTYYPLEKFYCEKLAMLPPVPACPECKSMAQEKLSPFINSTYPLSSPFFLCKCNTTTPCPCPCICPSTDLFTPLPSIILPDLTSASEVQSLERESMDQLKVDFTKSISTNCTRSFLYQFFFNLNGYSWKYSNGWKNNNRVCFLPPILYDGISANYENPYKTGVSKKKFIEVNSIALPANGLYGKLPTSFSLLKKSGRVLDLNYNLLSGYVSRELLLLPNIQIISIKGNLLSGTLGGEPLEEDDLHENKQSLKAKPTQVQGKVDTNLNEALNAVMNFDFSPPPLKISSFHKLLKTNSFNKITNLLHLDLSYNDIEGLIPPCFHLYPYLEVLNLSGNSFEGELPLNLSLCKYLKELKLQDNMLYGDIPSDYQELINLEVVDLSKNQLTRGLSVFISLPRLRHLQLDSNEFEEPVSVFLASSSTTLRYLNLSNNSFYGPMLDDLHDDSEHFGSQVFESQMDGVPLPSTIFNENSLEFAQKPGDSQVLPNRTPMNNHMNSNSSNLLSSSSFSNMRDKSMSTSQSLPNFASQSQLLEQSQSQILEQSQSHLFEPSRSLLHLPSSGSSTSSEASFLETHQHFTTTTTENRMNFSTLTYLNLSNNFLEGTLPSELFLLKKLQYLYLHNNRFVGPLPKNAAFWQNQPFNKDNPVTFAKSLPSLVDLTWFRAYPSENLAWPRRLLDHQANYRVLYDSQALGIDNVYWEKPSHK